MASIIKFNEGRKEVWHILALEDLCTDIKPMLVVQVKELINEIEDCEAEAASVASVRTVQFLDNCYQQAA